MDSQKYFNSGKDTHTHTHTQTERHTHLQYLDDTFFIVSDVDSLKYFTVLPSAQLLHYLVIVLITAAVEKGTN